MEGLSKMIIEEFERIMPINMNRDDLVTFGSEISLYLASKKYIEENG